MKLITVKQLFSDSQKYLEQEIEVGGWVRSNRGSKAFGFLVLIISGKFPRSMWVRQCW